MPLDVTPRGVLTWRSLNRSPVISTICKDLCSEVQCIMRMVAWDLPLPTPPDRVTDRYLWKHYLPATSLVGGKYENAKCAHINFVNASKTATLVLIRIWMITSFMFTSPSHKLQKKLHFSNLILCWLNVLSWFCQYQIYPEMPLTATYLKRVRTLWNFQYSRLVPNKIIRW